MRRRKRIEVKEGTIGAVRRLKPTDELEWDVVQPELSTYLKSTKDAKDALACLVAAGCDETSVLRNLYLFCGGKPEEMRAVRTALNLRGSKSRMLAIADLLQKASSEVQVAEQMLADQSLNHTLTPDCAALDRYADFLRRVGEHVYDKLASERISGRDQHLVYLCRLVERFTGREHYRELTDLVNAARRLYQPGSTKIETVETIHKRVWRNRRLVFGSELEQELELIEDSKALSRKEHQ